MAKNMHKGVNTDKKKQKNKTKEKVAHSYE